MTAAKPSRSCADCRYGGSPGIHWVEPDDAAQQPYSVPCPAAAADDERKRLETVVAEYRADEKTAAMRAAQHVIRDMAATRAEFSANDARTAFRDANVPPSLIGYAFRWARSEQLIVETGRFVQSTEATTRHRLPIWTRAESSGYRRGEKAS